MPFTIYLDTFNTANWYSSTNSIYDCEFPIDLKMMLKPEDFNKKYKMVWSIYSESGLSNINGTPCIRINVNMGRSWASINGLQRTNCIGFTTLGTQSGNYRFQTGYTINPPLIIDNLVDISSIKLQFLTDATTIMTNTNGNTQRYLMTMFFDETLDGT